MNKIYSHGHNNFFDKILIKKREEMKQLIAQSKEGQGDDCLMCGS